MHQERQAVGIAKAKAEGVYKGRPVSLDHQKIKELRLQGPPFDTDLHPVMLPARCFLTECCIVAAAHRIKTATTGSGNEAFALNRCRGLRAAEELGRLR